MQQRGLGVLAVAGRLAAQPVDGPVARGGDDPPSRAGRQPGLRPAPDRLGERVLHRVFGDVDIAEDAGRGGANPRPPASPAESTMGRTSTGSLHASVALRAQPSAASRSGALIIQKPPMCSLPSANGPSVTSTPPSAARTTVAVSGGCSPALNTQAP